MNISSPQKILVFQQDGSGENKIKGIRQYGNHLFSLEVYPIDTLLPPLIENSKEYLPQQIRADIVLDFLRHPDLSYDLGIQCANQKIPVVASGKKHRIQGVITPPT